MGGRRCEPACAGWGGVPAGAGATVIAAGPAQGVEVRGVGLAVGGARLPKWGLGRPRTGETVNESSPCLRCAHPTPSGALAGLRAAAPPRHYDCRAVLLVSTPVEI